MERNQHQTAIAVAGPLHLELSSGVLRLPRQCCSYRQDAPEPVADLEDCVGALRANNSFGALSLPESAAIPERDRPLHCRGRSPMPPPTAVSGPSEVLLCFGAGMTDRGATLPETVRGPVAIGAPAAIETSGPQQQENLPSQLLRAESSGLSRNAWPESTPEPAGWLGSAGGQQVAESALRPTVPNPPHIVPDAAPSRRSSPSEYGSAPQPARSTAWGPEPAADASERALPRPLPQAPSGAEDDLRSQLAFAVRIRDNSGAAAAARPAKPLRASHAVSGDLLGNGEQAPPRQPVSPTPRATAGDEPALTLEARANGQPAGTRPSGRAASGAESAGEQGASHILTAPLEPSRASLSHERAPERPAEPALRSTPEMEPPTDREVRQITLRLESTSGQRVQVAVQDRTGEIRVAVCARDTGLAGRLREGAAQLVSRLEARGFAAELLPGAALFSGAHRWPEPGESPVSGTDTAGAGGPWDGGEESNHRGRHGSPPGWEPEGRE